MVTGLVTEKFIPKFHDPFVYVLKPLPVQSQTGPAKLGVAKKLKADANKVNATLRMNFLDEETP